MYSRCTRPDVLNARTNDTFKNTQDRFWWRTNSLSSRLRNWLNIIVPNSVSGKFWKSMPSFVFFKCYFFFFLVRCIQHLCIFCSIRLILHSILFEEHFFYRILSNIWSKTRREVRIIICFFKLSTTLLYIYFPLKNLIKWTVLFWSITNRTVPYFFHKCFFIFCIDPCRVDKFYVSLQFLLNRSISCHKKQNITSFRE